MRRITPALLLTVFLITLSLAGSAFGDSRTILVHDQDGSHIQKEISDRVTPVPPVTVNSQRNGVWWQRTVTGNIYSSTALCQWDMVFAGTTNGNPAYVENFSFYGEGIPLWSMDSESSVNYVAAADEWAVFADVEKNSAGDGAVINCWHGLSDIPTWTVNIPGCGVPSRCIEVSDDGELVVVALHMTAGSNPRVYTFDGDTGAEISTYDCPGSTSARALRITRTGDLAVIRASAMLHVIETATGALRWTGSTGASASGLAMSSDGQYLASGWTFLLVWEWNGTSYNIIWNNNGGGTSWYLGACGFGPMGSTLMAAWYSSSFNQNKVQWFDIGSSTPMWEYTAPPSGGGYQDLPSDVAIGDFGEFAIVGSWGDQNDTNAQINVFHIGDPEPAMEIHSPGSIFDVDIQTMGTTFGERGLVVLMTACGKHTHANEMGSGGDLYTIEATTSAAPEISPTAISPLTSFPNPFNPKTTLGFTLTGNELVELAIYSPDGRLVRNLLSEVMMSGDHRVNWDGTDDTGHLVSSGIYLARLQGVSTTSLTRLVMLR